MTVSLQVSMLAKILWELRLKFIFIGLLGQVGAQYLRA